MRVMWQVDSEDQDLGLSCWVWCPGCKAAHRFPVGEQDGPTWTWDENVESPTFDPSMLVEYGGSPETRCHSYLRNGEWEFLADSTHALAGQTVPLPRLPDWLAEE